MMCDRRVGQVRCGKRLREVIDQIGRVVFVCDPCARKARGVCRTCPRRVDGVVGRSSFCGPCKRERALRQSFRYKDNNRQLVRKRDRAWHRRHRVNLTPAEYSAVRRAAAFKIPPEVRSARSALATPARVRRLRESLLTDNICKHPSTRST